MARALVGATLIQDTAEGRRSGRIVETEAYPPGDAASHAFRGETRRNGTMFRSPGLAYVYLSYGCWPALNVSSEAEGVGGGVLIRAAEPLDGIAAMRAARRTERILDLARGPGRLTGAFGVALAQDGVDLLAGGALRIEAPAPHAATVIAATTRIGISRDAEKPLRFFLRGSPFVSGPRRALGGFDMLRVQPR